MPGLPTALSDRRGLGLPINNSSNKNNYIADYYQDTEPGLPKQ